MTSPSEIKRYADGSIDYRYYENLGRRARGRAVAGMAVRVRVAFCKSIALVARLAYVTAPSRPSISAPSAL